MRCVKETLPPRDRARWLLMTMRLSASSLAGTARTLVAVGTLSEASMFWTIRAATPFNGTLFSDTPSVSDEAGAAAFGRTSVLDGFAATGTAAAGLVAGASAFAAGAAGVCGVAVVGADAVFAAGAGLAVWAGAGLSTCGL